MEDPDELKDLVKIAIEECTDFDMLDLVYKLLICENVKGQSL